MLQNINTEKSMYFMGTRYLFIVILLITVMISGCTSVSEGNIDAVAQKMQDTYDNINPIRVEITRENFEKGTKGIFQSISTVVIKSVEKPDKQKITFSEGFANKKVANIWVKNKFYDEREDKIFYYNCESNVFDKPDFVDELKSMLSKWGSIELVGSEVINEKNTHKIMLGKESKGHYIWINKENFLPVKEKFAGQYEKTYTYISVNEDILDSVFEPGDGKETIQKGCDDEEEEVEGRTENTTMTTIRSESN